MDNRAFFGLLLFFGIWYMCTGQSLRSPWCKERRRELRDQREGLMQELRTLRHNLTTIKKYWNVKGEKYRQEKNLESISQIASLITEVKPFNSSVYEFCKNCPWDRCSDFKSRLQHRMQGLNDALKRLNDYMSVPDSGPQIAQAGSPAFAPDPYTIAGAFIGALDNFP